MLLMFVLSVAVAMPSATAQDSQYAKAKKKAQKKEYKAKLKEYKKGKWEIFGTSHTMEVALLDHYEKLEEEGAREYMGVASSFISMNVGQQSAMNSACNKYAHDAQTMVRGRVMSDLFSDADDVPAEFDKFYSAYESMVVKEIKGEMTPTYSIVRVKGKDEKGRKIYEMRSFYVVNENAAAKARLRAMETALEESNMAQQYAKRISNFVREEAPAE